MKSSLKRVLAALEKLHAPEPLVAKSAFEVVLWENVAYLVDDGKRRRAFEALEKRVGLTPEAIGDAKKGVIEGAVGVECAQKLQRAAEVALEIGHEELERAVTNNTREAKRLLKRFPGIGDPGADRILMLLGGARTVAPESNGLRVLCRLGLVEEQKSYAATYRKAVAALELPSDPAREHALLREHGRLICRRSAPHCEACPLTKTCAFYQATAGRAAKDRV